MFQIGHDNFHLDFNIRKNGICFSNLAHKFCSYTTNTTNQSADIKLSLPAGKKITIYWGDGTSTVITGEVYKVIYSHIYTDVKTYNLTVTGDYNDITYLRFNGDGSYGGDIKYMPSGLKHFDRFDANTFCGNIQYIPAGMDYFVCYGSNTFNGDIQTLTSELNLFVCGGRNTLIGDLAVFADSVSYLKILGDNTISEYSGCTWTHNFTKFQIEPVAPGGLSSAEIDQLLIDLDNDLDWSGGGIIYLTGTNAPRTSASDDAVSNIEAEGGTIFTN